ncbi:MAG: hypothetical protein OXF56_16200 [Rhodobacteraceae bacterium]|nr:hypothetical protein [Paracoccaceae bacterium]MCY4139792.1 hypothetical protein [Paracoccaceae bacterium]
MNWLTGSPALHSLGACHASSEDKTPVDAAAGIDRLLNWASGFGWPFDAQWPPENTFKYRSG